MDLKTLLPNAIQYAIAILIGWLLISGEISETSFFVLFLLYALVAYVVRRRSRSQSASTSPVASHVEKFDEGHAAGDRKK